MGTINMVKAIKKVHQSCVIIVKIGNFYHVYGKDAYIFSYMFQYKITEKEGVPTCGFPINAISKVENNLEKSKINYIVVDRKSNYEEEEKYINKQENNYDKIFEKSKAIVAIIFRIQKITDYLKENKEKESIEKILGKMEEILYDEGRKV